LIHEVERHVGIPVRIIHKKTLMGADQVIAPNLELLITRASFVATDCTMAV
jgi:hypothetical protein